MWGKCDTRCAPRISTYLKYKHVSEVSLCSVHTYHHENALVLAHQSRKRTLYTHNHTRNKITRAQRQPTPRVPLRSETPRVSLVLRPERHTTLPCPQRSQISTASYPKYQLPHTVYRAKSTAKVPLAHDISRAPQCHPRYITGSSMSTSAHSFGQINRRRQLPSKTAGYQMATCL
jgi:hypothetical protein